MKIGHNIATLRKASNLTQGDLAEILHVKRSLVGSWEEGRANPSLETIDHICDYFDVTFKFLINSKTPPTAGCQSIFLVKFNKAETKIKSAVIILLGL